MRRNKFLNASVRPKRHDRTKETTHRERGKEYEVLQKFAACWYSLMEARRKLERSIMYTYEDQWGDLIKDPNTGEMITEGELIKKEGKVPLKNNMISPIVKNIDGQFRSNTTKTICTVRDKNESKIGEMMSIAMEYSHSLNEIVELDSNTLRMLECGGFVAQRIEFGYNENKHNYDAWVYNVNPSRLFFNSNIEDPRAWDLNCIGEIYDLTFDQLAAAFSKSPSDRKWLEKIYGDCDETREYLYSSGLQGHDIKFMDFYTPTRTSLCRVILGWTLESRDAYFYQDTLDGTWGFVGMNEKSVLDAENEKRMAEAAELGMDEEDVLLIDYEYKVERYWYYRYLTPWGDVLQEGRSPYWHGQHNYAFHVYTIIQGKVFNFIEDFIDQQRAINRTMTLIDFIRSASAKGLLIVDETAFENMSREEIIDEYVRYNGVLFVKLKAGQNVDNIIKQYNGAASIQGDYELLNLQLKLISDISGVNSAMQGKEAPASTAASLYAQQVQNASMNLKGLFDSFKAFRKRRDVKLMQTIQQFYTSARHLEVSGKDYAEESKYYDPEKVQNAQMNLEITEGTNTPTYQALENELLMQLLQMQVIDAMTFLENSSLPFAPRIAESLKRMKQQAEEQGQVPQMSPELMQQMQSGNPMMQKAMNDAYAQPNDGQVIKAA